MPRAYIRVDPNLFERKALHQKYPAGAIAAYLGCLCLGETQPERGHFRDRRLLGALLGPMMRWIPFLIEHGDLIETSAYPQLYVEGWKEWQEGDVTVPDRMARLRARKRGDTPPVTAAVTPAVTVPDTTARIAQDGSGSARQIAEAHAQDADPRVPLSSKHQPEALGDIFDRIMPGLENGDIPEQEDAFVFAVRILGYAPNSDDFRAEITALEDKHGIEKTVQAVQDVYRIALQNGHRLKPFDLVKDVRTLLATGKHREERILSAQEKAEQAAKRKADDAAMIADIDRQHAESLRKLNEKKASA